MPRLSPNAFDDEYLSIIREALHVCRRHKPRFGGGNKSGYSLGEFQELYGRDPFYSWFGLDSDLMYTAHKAAGGITSVYRQLGIACERMFRRLLQNQLDLSPDQSKWVYKVPTTTGKSRSLSLDGRIPINDVSDEEIRSRIKAWLGSAAQSVMVKGKAARALLGPVFEVRQGYKSKDSKRQNADILNASNAYANNYLPIVLLLSTQIDADVAERYVRAQWLLLRGSVDGTPLSSTYAFCREILGYDLAGFFARNSASLKSELEVTLRALLK
jgi:hypothetical protein